MRKTQQIHVAGRRQRSNIKDFIRQSPSQTLSAVPVIDDSGNSSDLCTTVVPTPRIDCGGEDDPCVDKYSPGSYFDTLVSDNNYWIPQSDNVSYYKQIYFDGMPVFENEQYWLDGLKVYPMDPAIFVNTDATAEVVIR